MAKTIKIKNVEEFKMKEIYEFLKECKTYYLSTIENGQPRVRPFGTIDLFEDKLYIQTGKVKQVSAQMKENPNIEICGMLGDKWIRVTAEAVLDENIAAQEHMLAAYPELQAMYKPNDGNTEVFYLKNGTAQICSFTQPAKIIRF